MAEVPITPAPDRTLRLDVCVGCHFVWFDPREFEALPKLPGKPAEQETLSPQAREAVAMMRLEALKEQSAMSDMEARAPDHSWELALGLYGIPVEYNDTPLEHQPVMTWLLAAAIAVVSILAFRDLEAAVTQWGLIPAQFMRHFGLTFATSFFLHGGPSHLIGNLYFLVVFGDNTEDVLGKRRFLLLVALAAIVGHIAHILSDPTSDIPCIGASGGISGVLAYYCLRFPRASVGMLWCFRWIRMPVGIMFALWVLMQFFGAVELSAGIGNVAVYAHLGGAAVGILFWWWTRRSFSADAASLATRPLKTT